MSDKQMGSINVDIGGRLGNQMFQYAFARSLQEKYYPDHALNLCFRLTKRGGSSCEPGGSDGWKNDLQLFNICPYKEVGSIKLPLSQTVYAGRYFIEKRILKKPDIERSAQEYLQAHGIYTSRASYYIPVEQSNYDFIYIRGRFEAHKYFDSIRGKLLDEFTPLASIGEINKKLFD